VFDRRASTVATSCTLDLRASARSRARTYLLLARDQALSPHRLIWSRGGHPPAARLGHFRPKFWFREDRFFGCERPAHGLRAFQKQQQFYAIFNLQPPQGAEGTEAPVTLGDNYCAPWGFREAEGGVPPVPMVR
jgi:hypothetical protein